MTKDITEQKKKELRAMADAAAEALLATAQASRERHVRRLETKARSR